MAGANVSVASTTPTLTHYMEGDQKDLQLRIRRQQQHFLFIFSKSPYLISETTHQLPVLRYLPRAWEKSVSSNTHVRYTDNSCYVRVRYPGFHVDLADAVNNNNCVGIGSRRGGNLIIVRYNQQYWIITYQSISTVP